MKETIASTYLYTIIIIFLLIVFGFAGGLITYQKAYKVNSKIANAIEKAEGYNDNAIPALPEYQSKQTPSSQLIQSWGMSILLFPFLPVFCSQLKSEK